MIRIALECALVFLLPAVAYFAYTLLATDAVDAATGKQKSPAQLVEQAPLLWLFALGTLLLGGMLLAFATLQDQNIDKPYAPAVYKDGKIQDGSAPKAP